jgi:hypothetical protein
MHAAAHTADLLKFLGLTQAKPAPLGNQRPTEEQLLGAQNVKNLFADLF